MNNLAGISKDSVVYGLGSSVKKLIGFFLIPIYTRAISQTDYGILDLLSVFILLGSSILGFGLNMGIGRYYFQTNSQSERGELLFTILILRVITTVIIMFLLPLSDFFSNLLIPDSDSNFLIVLALFIIPTTLLNADQEVILRYNQKPWHFNLLVIVKSLGNILLGVGFVLVLKLGIEGAMLAQLFSSIIILIIAYIFFNKNIYTYKFNFYWFDKLLRFSLPFIVASISSWFFYSSNRFIIGLFDSYSNVAIVAVAFAIIQPISLLNNAINQSASVIIMKVFTEDKEANKHNTKKLIISLWENYLLISLFLSLCISIFAFDIITFISPNEYSGGAIFVPLFAFSMILTFSPELVCWGPIFMEQTKSIAKIFFFSAIINVFLSYYLLLFIGLIGIAVAFFLSCLLYSIFFFIISQKMFYINHELMRISILFIFTMVISVLIPLLELYYQINLIFIIKILILIIYILISIKLKFITKQHLLYFFRKLWKKGNGK